MSSEQQKGIRTVGGNCIWDGEEQIAVCGFNSLKDARIADARAARIVLCLRACERIDDKTLISWQFPPQGQLGAPHGTWAAQLADAGRKQVELQKHINRLVSIAKTFRSHIGGATWTLVDDERELAKFVEEAIAEAEAA